MAVAFDFAVESVRTVTTDPWTWTHTPSGTPRAIVVAAIHGVTATSHVTGVTYGGVAMTKVVDGKDTVTEPGTADLWFLGASIPTGNQTVSADLDSATGDDIEFVSMSFTAAADCEVVDSDEINENTANPSVTLQYGGRTCMAIGALYGGGAAPSSFTENANCTRVADHDLGAFYAVVLRQTNVGSADFAIGGTASSDDVGYAALAVGELDPNVTVALTGVAGSSAVGSVVASLALALSGIAGTGAVGTLTPDRTLALTGVAATAAVGTLAPGSSFPLGGVAGTGAVGTVTVLSNDVTLALTGVSGPGAVGTLGVETLVALSGVSAPSAVGTVTAASSLPLAGVSGTGAVGGLAPERIVPITGASGSGAVGTLTPGLAVGLQGVAGTSAVGTVTVLGNDLTFALSGVSAFAAVGTVARELTAMGSGPYGVTVTSGPGGASLGSGSPDASVSGGFGVVLL